MKYVIIPFILICYFYRPYVAIKLTNAATVEVYVYMMKMQTHMESSVIIRIQLNHYISIEII